MNNREAIYQSGETEEQFAVVAGIGETTDNAASLNTNIPTIKSVYPDVADLVTETKM